MLLEIIPSISTIQAAFQLTCRKVICFGDIYPFLPSSYIHPHSSSFWFEGCTEYQRAIQGGLMHELE